MTRNLSILFGFAVVLLIPSIGSASPWVLDERELVISGRFDFSLAEREFLKTGELQDFPLNGRLRSAGYETSIRFGVVENLEIEFNVPIKQITYRSDPVILVPCSEGASSSDCFQQDQGNVIDLSRTESGLADLRLSARYQFLQGAVAGAVGLEVKTPTGYDDPSGTFGSEPKDRQQFLDGFARFVQPENVQDDVTLGDGQLDLALTTLWGWSLPSRTFLRLDSGYVLRTRGAGDQITANLQIGQQLGQRFLLKAGTNFAYTVEDGEIIGISVAAEDPNLPAEDFGGPTNLRLLEVPLSEDRLRINAGMLARISERTELNLSYARLVWGRNVSRTDTVSLGLAFKFDLAEDDGGG